MWIEKRTVIMPTLPLPFQLKVQEPPALQMSYDIFFIDNDPDHRNIVTYDIERSKRAVRIYSRYARSATRRNFSPEPNRSFRQAGLSPYPHRARPYTIHHRFSDYC